MDITEIVKGGDERIMLGENGLNKYHVNPLDYENTFNRGSCTCSLLTKDSEKAINKLIKKLGSQDYNDVLDTQQLRLKKFINYLNQDKFDVFYAPSGSDLCYYPIMFSRIMYPEKEIYNLLTCPEELGSGSNIANNGKYYFNINQFGEKVPYGELIHPDIHIKQKTFSARDKEGNINNHKQSIINTIEENQGKDHIIANLVIGSKSGIIDNISIIPHADEKSFWVIDVCQLRATKKLINSLLNLNCMVMITGSKFYQSPPFCGALLVPKTITKQLTTITDKAVEPFLKIFSSMDIPSCLPKLKAKFRENENFGTLFRWEAAISEMELLTYFGEDTVASAVNRWNAFVVSQLQFNSDYFELMPDQHRTNRSIISFSVKKPGESLLNDVELRELFMKICTSERTDFGNYKKIIIGQPVKYENKSFIRLALGSYNVRNLLANNFNFKNDEKLIQIIIKEIRELFWK
ncbi:MAG: hypothetical protein JKY53_05425 [Flavobacteriales bacterium]|nr:hypothetical protein [Flavobacteriales bacterium]